MATELLTGQDGGGGPAGLSLSNLAPQSPNLLAPQSLRSLGAAVHNLDAVLGSLDAHASATQDPDALTQTAAFLTSLLVPLQAMQVRLQGAGPTAGRLVANLIAAIQGALAAYQGGGMLSGPTSFNGQPIPASEAAVAASIGDLEDYYAYEHLGLGDLGQDGDGIDVSSIDVGTDIAAVDTSATVDTTAPVDTTTAPPTISQAQMLYETTPTAPGTIVSPVTPTLPVDAPAAQDTGILGPILSGLVSLASTGAKLLSTNQQIAAITAGTTPLPAGVTAAQWAAMTTAQRTAALQGSTVLTGTSGPLIVAALVAAGLLYARSRRAS